MVWIRFYYIFLDRIYRMYKIFSRFPEETVKTASALRRNDIDIVSISLRHKLDSIGEFFNDIIVLVESDLPALSAFSDQVSGVTVPHRWCPH